MIDVLVFVVMGAILLMLGSATYRLLRDAEARGAYVSTLGAIRWWMVPAAAGHIVGVVTVIVLLIAAMPVLSSGWWMLLGGTGNIALGQTGRSGELWQLVGLIVPLWILVLAPHLAHREEMAFRYASEDDSRGERLLRLAIFGIGHSVVMGVPVAAGLALIGSGMLYQLVYLTSFNRLLTRTELVAVTTEPNRAPYPPTPEGRYDPAAWDAHHDEFNHVCEQNRVSLDEWLEEITEQAQDRQSQIDGVREIAATKAAALHAVSNWLIISLLAVLLIAGSF